MNRNTTNWNEQPDEAVRNGLEGLGHSKTTVLNVQEATHGIQRKLQYRRIWRRRRNASVLVLLAAASLVPLVPLLRGRVRDDSLVVQPPEELGGESTVADAATAEWASLRAEIAELSEQTDLLVARQRLLASQLEVAREEETNRQLRREQAVTTYWVSLDP